MKETTRIHIAKTSYDIEIAAKKALEKYISVLEAYAEDDELLNDIEIRITELLAERNVQPNGVITADDVKAVRTQLGEPEEFMDNGDIAIGPGVELSSNPNRKLYRNIDGAVFGGVLSGVAYFFNINPLWTRLIFIILLFVTAFMPMALIYVILWVVIPPARTAAEKLQMAGRPVTLAQIRELNESAVSDQAAGQTNVAQRVILSILGICSAVAAIGTALFTGFVALAIGFRSTDYLSNIQVPIDHGPEWPYLVAYGLAITSGLLLSALFGIIAYTLMARKFTKRIIIAIIIVIAAGATSFAAAAGIMSYRDRFMSEEIDRSMQTRTIELPVSFRDATSLKTTFHSADVKYIVDATPRMIVTSVENTSLPKMDINDKQATLSFDGKDYGNFSKAFTRITVYGPKLEAISADGTQINYKGGSGTLTVDSMNSASVIVKDGSYQLVTARPSGQSSIEATDATVEQVVVDAKDQGRYSFGVVKTLIATVPEVCPSTSGYAIQSWGTIAGVSSGKMTYNSTERPATNGTVVDQPCAYMSIGQSTDTDMNE
ncbi:hypothetical protein A2707_05985 [Candidatus Saccharibacteria bacterium RIFCSPHIGHO2_01_FULL_45_15]|nr:MAG: hypothetical protein A2707_05985 [Candidatus Saccharibacteria bacterium RIFCSPHIGHO2_01_FULL_45_15]OGL28995.1 MAG: hypothetical protein A3C39_06210 [Candidatus Saccharibacteria bacterium RIFCSPHIGHO2_02_FULL_46_12]OGL32010.1 MAG: hypothetical protein A3E76_01930 [Candidatus Saccharibacteria bacterium RIFCSPHIGHO2_12_FULL_44_22]